MFFKEQTCHNAFTPITLLFCFSYLIGAIDFTIIIMSVIMRLNPSSHNLHIKNKSKYIILFLSCEFMSIKKYLSVDFVAYTDR